MSRLKAPGYPQQTPLSERAQQLLARGREHYEKHDFQKAAGALHEALVEAPHMKRADVFNMLGVIHHDQGKLEKARQAFERALSINPGYTEAALNLSVTCNDLGLYGEAKRIYEEALSRRETREASLDPYVRGKIANLHAKVGRAYAEAGMLEEAEAELHKALGLCPDFADLRLTLAKILEKRRGPRGRPAGALGRGRGQAHLRGGPRQARGGPAQPRRQGGRHRVLPAGPLHRARAQGRRHVPAPGRGEQEARGRKRRLTDMLRPPG